MQEEEWDGVTIWRAVISSGGMRMCSEETIYTSWSWQQQHTNAPCSPFSSHSQPIHRSFPSHHSSSLPPFMREDLSQQFLLPLFGSISLSWSWICYRKWITGRWAAACDHVSDNVVQTHPLHVVLYLFSHVYGRFGPFFPPFISVS